MARGKKTPPEMVYKVLTSYATTNNFNETARTLNISAGTVKTIVDANRGKPEFEKLQQKKKIEFADKASEIIDKGLRLLDRRINTALEYEDELDELIDEIFASDKEEISPDEKKALINKIKSLQVQKLGEITTAIGTLYDKRALAKGENTQNESINVNIKIID